jgi:two-component system KDP operon response regulator KdpE
VGGELVSLSKTEYRLLAYLLENASRVLTFHQILQHVWHDIELSQVETVHTYMWRLRKKLERDPGHPRYLLTEHMVGYSFQGQAV